MRTGTLLEPERGEPALEKPAALAALAALAQETRLDVFRMLVRAGPEGLAAGRLAERLRVPAPTLSFHLKALRSAGIVAATRTGRTIVYRADYAAMSRLLGYLTQQCCAEPEPTSGIGEACCAPNEPPDIEPGERYE